MTEEAIKQFSLFQWYGSCDYIALFLDWTAIYLVRQTRLVKTKFNLTKLNYQK